MKTIDYINAVIAGDSHELQLPEASQAHIYNCHHYLNVVREACNGSLYGSFESFYSLRNLASYIQRTHRNFYKRSIESKKDYQVIVKRLMILNRLIGPRNLKNGVIPKPDLPLNSGTSELVLLMSRYIKILALSEISNLTEYQDSFHQPCENDLRIIQQSKSHHGDFLTLISFFATKALLDSDSINAELRSYVEEYEIESPIYDEFIFSIISKAIYMNISEDFQ